MLVIHQGLGQDFHAEFGPWVTSTKGEPWPLPHKRSFHDGFRLIRPETLTYKVSKSIYFSSNRQHHLFFIFLLYLFIQYNQGHSILAEAVERYQNIITKESEIGYRSSKHQYKSVQDDPNYKGDINEILFHVPLDEETHPYLHMSESCQYNNNKLFNT